MAELAEQPQLSTDRYVSRAEAARRLGVPPRTIQHMASVGRLPHIRTFGGHRRFSIRDLDAAAAERGKPRQRRPRSQPQGTSEAAGQPAMASVAGLTASTLASEGDRITVEVLGRRLEVWAALEDVDRARTAATMGVLVHAVGSPADARQGEESLR